MKKSLLGIILAAATLPLTFAQANPPAGQAAPEQKTTASTSKAKTNKKHNSKKTTSSSTTGSTASKPAQK